MSEIERLDRVVKNLRTESIKERDSCRPGAIELSTVGSGHGRMYPLRWLESRRGSSHEMSASDNWGRRRNRGKRAKQPDQNLTLMAQDPAPSALEPIEAQPYMAMLSGALESVDVPP